MGGKTEIVRGRIKEDAGALTGNNTSREEGQADQMVGRARQVAQAAIDKAMKVAQNAVDTLRSQSMMFVVVIVAASLLPGNIAVAQGPPGGKQATKGGSAPPPARQQAAPVHQQAAPARQQPAPVHHQPAPVAHQGGPVVQNRGGPMNRQRMGGTPPAPVHQQIPPPAHRSGGVVQDTGNGGNRGRDAAIHGGRGGADSLATRIGPAAHQDGGVQNHMRGTNVTHAQPTFMQNTFSSQHLRGNALPQGNNFNQHLGNRGGNDLNRHQGASSPGAQNVTANRHALDGHTHNQILHDQQLSGSHWNGDWSNQHNHGYWGNRSYFFGGGSPFGYGNGSYGYPSPYSYGFSGLGYGVGGYGLGGYGLGGYGLGGYGLGYGLGGLGLDNYGNGGYGYGGYPSYGYYSGASAYAVQGQAAPLSNDVYAEAPIEEAPNDDTPAVPQSQTPQRPADDALDFAGHGELDFAAGRYEGAVRNWKHALVDDPNNGALVLLLAQGLLAVAQYDQAAGATQMAMQMLPQDKWGAVIENYKQLYGNIGDYTNQLRALEKARDAKPADSALRFLLGYHFGYLGHPKQAVRELDKTLELNAKDQGARKVRDVFAAKLGLAPGVLTPEDAAGQSTDAALPAPSAQAVPRQAEPSGVVDGDSTQK
jgi:uncharacterized protein YjbJ (UPF0337 family)/Flp pilus assembly protein TadD